MGTMWGSGRSQAASLWTQPFPSVLSCYKCIFPPRCHMDFRQSWAISRVWLLNSSCQRGQWFAVDEKVPCARKHLHAHFLPFFFNFKMQFIHMKWSVPQEGLSTSHPLSQAQEAIKLAAIYFPLPARKPWLSFRNVPGI